MGPRRPVGPRARFDLLQRRHRPARSGSDGCSCLERIRSTWFWLSGRCASSASDGRMPATKRSRCRFHAAGALEPVVSRTPLIDHSTRETSVLLEVEAHPAVRLRVSEQLGDERARRPHEMVIGLPQLRQTTEMLRLVRARRPEEMLEPRAVGQRGRVLGHGDRRLEDLCHQRLDEGLLGGEAAVERAHPDPGRPGHVSHAGLEALLLEDLTRRHEQTLPVLQGVAAHWSGQGCRAGAAPPTRRALIRRFHSAYPTVHAE